MLRLALTAVASLTLIASSSASDDLKVEVRHNTEFPVEVHGTIKSASARVGDTVEFRTEIPVLIGNKIVVPNNATILGTVTEVRHGEHDWPRSLIRIRIHTLRWKDQQIHLNAMVTSIRRVRHMTAVATFGSMPTFLEGVRVVSHLQHNASTEFVSDQKDVVIRSGVSFMIRQIDPDAYPDDDLRILTSNTPHAPKN
jgi:hypothetical protein